MPTSIDYIKLGPRNQQYGTEIQQIPLLMVLIILSCIYFFFYCPWAWFTYSRILNSYDHNKHYKPDLPEKYKPFMRYDIINWSKAEIWFGAFILIPIRAPVVLLSMFTFNLVLLIASKGGRVDKPWTRWFRIWLPVLYMIAKSCVFMCGLHTIKHTIKRYSELEPNYKQSEEDRVSKPAVIVSNHVSWYDIFIYMSRFMASFLSKESVRHYPIAGMTCMNMKGVFVSRESEKSRQQVYDAIHFRIRAIKENLFYPPLLIFPEGTVSNGRYLLSFKRGAFEPLQPVKICCMKYEDRRFNLSLTIPFFDLIMLSLTQLHNQAELIEFEGLYNPQYLNLEQYPQEKRWEVYAEKVKDIMARTLGVEKSGSGYRDFNEYDKQLQAK